jgi:hypothetical protein
MDRTPEATELDYFSLKANHRTIHQHHHHQNHPTRSNSGPNLDHTERIAITPISASYGSKTNNMLSYLWESEKHRLSPTDRLTDTPNEIQSPAYKQRNSRLNRTWTMTHPKLKIPSNTAPGIRHHAVGSLGSHSSALPSPAIITPTTPLFNKEGKVLTDATEMKLEFTNLEHFDSERFFQYNYIPLMDTKGMAQRDCLRLGYADMLYRWNLLDQRAEVLRFLSHQPFPVDKEVTSTNIQVSCYACGTELSTKDKYCMNCRKIRKLIRCCFCHILVKGLVNFCVHCGHGGHSNHMEDWFVTNQQVYCMTGCGCKCALEPLDFSH